MTDSSEWDMNNCHGPNDENVSIFSLRLSMRSDDRSETRLKTFCILIRSQTLVAD